MISLDLRFDAAADRWCWLRGAPDGSAADEARARVAAVFEPLPRHAFLLLDPAVAALAGRPDELRSRAALLPEEVAGVAARAALLEVAAILDDAPEPGPERARSVDEQLRRLDRAGLVRAAVRAATALGFWAGDDPIDVLAVHDGVPLGGVTGETLDDRPVCLVATAGLGPSTLAETIVHEMLHAIDIVDVEGTSLVDRLRGEAPDRQLWHVPMFTEAAAAVRAEIDPAHRDLGTTGGYYSRVPKALAELRARGLVGDLR